MSTSSPDNAGATPASIVQRAIETVSCLVIAGLGGGVLCGLVIDRYGVVGSISLWALGALSGFVARKLISHPSRVVGWSLVVACVVALAFAEVCWIHWNTKQGAEGWWIAVTFLPTFVREYEVAAFVAAVFTGLGAWSAYRQVAVRYRLVAVDDESP